MKHIILFSGGLDSTTLLYLKARQGQGPIIPVFFNYGQKSYNKEKAAVEYIIKQLGLNLIEIDVMNIFIRSNTSLMTADKQDPEVEFRNGVFLSASISLAMQLFPKEKVAISFGAIQMREPFYDCTTDFTCRYNGLAQAATNGLVSVCAPFIDNGKDDVLKLGRELNVPIMETWSCYEGGDKPCGKCLACIDRKILGVDK